MSRANVGAYYNEIDPFAASWLRNLIAAGHLPAGDVDERSIVDVRGDDLRGYGACHFFAGIGGWPLALRLAGVPDDAPVWSGSCPCQPFSVAGRGAGTADERHLWPAFHALIAERHPPAIFGEQVASAAGRVWLAGVRADLEALGYAVGAADLAAASVGAPHIRQRLYWLADAEGGRGGPGLRESDSVVDRDGTPGGGRARGVAHAGDKRRRPGIPELLAPGTQPHADGRGLVDGMGDALKPRLEGHAGDGDRGSESGRLYTLEAGSASATGGAWDGFELVPFPDGKVRRIESGIAPLATGVPARVGRLRAYGNAICVPLAAEFVSASLEAIGA